MKKWLTLSAFLAVILVLGSVGVARAAEPEPPQAQGDRGSIRGTVMDINGHTLTVRTPRGEVHVVTNNDTVFRIPGVEDPSIDDIAVGDFVVVLGRWTGQTLHARLVGAVSPEDRLPRIIGQVTAIEGNDLTVNARSGQVILVHTEELIPTPQQDSLLAGYAMVLMAQALGLGTCFVSLAEKGLNAGRRSKALVGLAPEANVHAVILLGFSQEPFARPAPKPIKEVAWI